MTFKEAKKLQNGSQITIKKTGVKKIVFLTTECTGKYGDKYVDIMCNDYTAYYNTEVEKA